MKKAFYLTFLMISTALVGVEQNHPCILKTPKIEVLDVENNYDIEHPEMIKKGFDHSKGDIDPHWIHEIQLIDEDGSKLTLRDGTVWSIGWWWQSTVRGWMPDDQILISFDFTSFFNFVEFYNKTQNDTAWGNVYDLPKKENSYAKSVLDFENYFYTIILNDGFRLHGPVLENSLPMFAYWRKKDFIVPISVCGRDNPHALWNIIREEIAVDLQLD